MISAPDRRETLQLIEDAVAAGARRARAGADQGLWSTGYAFFKFWTKNPL